MQAGKEHDAMIIAIRNNSNTTSVGSEIEQNYQYIASGKTGQDNPPTVTPKTKKHRAGIIDRLGSKFNKYTQQLGLLTRHSMVLIRSSLESRRPHMLVNGLF